jgi:hypothetical protein
MLLIAKNLLDDNSSCVRVFLEHDKDRVTAAEIGATTDKRIEFCSMSDTSLASRDSVYVIYNPDNVMSSRLDLLEGIYRMISSLKYTPLQ